MRTMKLTLLASAFAGCAALPETTSLFGRRLQTSGQAWLNPNDELTKCIALVTDVNAACPCEGRGCSGSAPVPSACDAGCAEVFNPFYEQCEEVLSTLNGMSAQMGQLEGLYALCQAVDLGSTSGVCELDGTWDTNFGEIQIRGQEGAYLDTWGNLYDVAWVSPTQAQGTFHNTNVDQVGRFTWTFAAADCDSFRGQWGWELDDSMNGAWNGQRTSADAPMSPEAIDDSDMSVAGEDIYNFRTTAATRGWSSTVDGVMGGRSTGSWEFDRAHECALFNGEIELAHGGFSNMVGPRLSATDAAALAAADGVEICAEELLPGAPTLFKFQLSAGGYTQWQADFTVPREDTAGGDCDGGVVRVAFADLYPTAMGRVVGTRGAIDKTRIVSVGLSLSFLEDDGDTNAELDKTRVPNIVPFALCLHWMRPYSGAAAPAPTAAAGPGAVAGMAGPFTGMGISGFNDLGSSDEGAGQAGVRACAAKCLAKADCRSFDWGARGSVAGECWLSTADRASAGDAYTAWGSYDYYEVDASAGAAGGAKDLVATLVSMPGTFSTLVAAVTAAGLAPTLSGPGPFTVFAPTDAAFAALGQATISAVLADPARLADILTYHVHAGSVHAADLYDGELVSTVEGQPIAVAVSRRTGVTLNRAAHVTQADVDCSNGVAHVIDTVLLPPATAGTGATGAGNKACWALSDRSYARCCDAAKGRRGDASCWTSASFSYDNCCSSNGH